VIRTRDHRLGRAAAVVLVAAGALAGACRGDPGAERAIHGGDPDRGRLAIRHYGCGTCHEIPGVDGAHGHVGPSLAELSSRGYLAGQLPNTPDHLLEWIQHPQSVEPGNVMPDMLVTQQDALDIAAVLYRAR
jgi:cytochrome c2